MIYVSFRYIGCNRERVIFKIFFKQVQVILSLVTIFLLTDLKKGGYQFSCIYFLIYLCLLPHNIRMAELTLMIFEI